MATTQVRSTDGREVFTVTHDDDDVVLPDDLYVGYGTKHQRVVRRAGSNLRYIREIMHAQDDQVVLSYSDDPFDLRRETYYIKRKTIREQMRPRTRHRHAAMHTQDNGTPTVIEMPRYITVAPTSHDDNEDSVETLSALLMRKVVLEKEIANVQSEIEAMSTRMRESSNLSGVITQLFDLLVR